MPVTILVPRGAEEAAVRRRARGAVVHAIAAGAASALPAGLDGAALVVVTGLCGSLTAARVGDVVVYTRVVGPEGGDELDSAGVVRLLGAMASARPVAACTTDHVVTTAVERRALAARTGADVVDMEGVVLARALRARGLAFAMVRVVSDDPSADLPPIEDALDPSGTIRPFALAGAFARKPFAAARFVRDVQASLRVLGSTAAVLAALK